jgi:hypothetical protein
LISSDGRETEMRVTICQILMQNKELGLYEEVYQYLLDVLIENSVLLEGIFVRTDAEFNIFRGFENVFSAHCPVTHNLCKRHYTANLRVNLQKKGKIAWLCFGGNLYNESFKNFYEKIKLIGNLPVGLIIEMREFLIMELLEHFEPLEFVKYVREKINVNFAKRISYYNIIKKSDKYVPVTTNAAESVNSILNRFLSSLSKSSKLVTILKNSRQFFCAEYRLSERQWESQISDYRPSATALNNFLRAKSFIAKIDKTSLKPHSKTLRKISKLMDPKNYYSDTNLK